MGWASTAFPGPYVASGWEGPPATCFRSLKLSQKMFFEKQVVT